MQNQEKYCSCDDPMSTLQHANLATREPVSYETTAKQELRQPVGTASGVILIVMYIHRSRALLLFSRSQEIPRIFRTLRFTCARHLFLSSPYPNTLLPEDPS